LSEKRVPKTDPGRLKQLRQTLGLTQRELAARLGVSFSTVNRWEKGRAEPSGLARDQIDSLERDSSSTKGDGSETHVGPGVLAPGVLPGLWTHHDRISFSEMLAYFSGQQPNHVLEKKADRSTTAAVLGRETLERLVREAVVKGELWLLWGRMSIFADEIPPGVLTDDATLHPPPPRVSAVSLMPDQLPQAWQGETTTALVISLAVSQRAGQPLPWAPVRDAIDAALLIRVLELADDSSSWPSTEEGSAKVKLRLPGAFDESSE
jgi:putative transcriptional regulator